MAITVSLSPEEHVRVMRMTAAALDILRVDASKRNGNPDDTDTRVLEVLKQNSDRIDLALALDLADRLGESALREAVEEYTPRTARASIDALIKRHGGMLPLIKDRIGGKRSLSGATTLSSDLGCALGAAAIVGGVLIDEALGGFGAVVGILVMATQC